MRTKSLVFGSAVAFAAATGAAQAADAVVLAPAPEPVNYVRVCDMYGVGFFYIPGSETCLRISGQIRYQVEGNGHYSDGDDDFGDGYTKFSRIQINLDARSETSMGTLRAYGELRSDWSWDDDYDVGPDDSGYYYDTYINQAYIELQQSMGTWRIGLSDTPYATFLGYGAYDAFDGTYAFNNSGILSYTFNGGNGFSAIVAAVDAQEDASWSTNFEGGVNFAQGWGSIGGIFGYDAYNSQWGAKAVARFNLSSMFSGGLHVFYSSGDYYDHNTYAITQPLSDHIAPWSVLVHAKAAFSPTIAVDGHFQWFAAPRDAPSYADNNEYELVGGLEWTPLAMASDSGQPNLLIAPQVKYDWGQDYSYWTWNIRIDRNF